MSVVVVGRGVSYELTTGRELFTDLDFEFGTGRAALVGPNGVGKSTLARIVAGELPATAGTLTRHGSINLLRQYESPPGPRSPSTSRRLTSGRTWARACSSELPPILPAAT